MILMDLFQPEILIHSFVFCVNCIESVCLFSALQFFWIIFTFLFDLFSSPWVENGAVIAVIFSLCSRGKTCTIWWSCSAAYPSCKWQGSTIRWSLDSSHWFSSVCSLFPQSSEVTLIWGKLFSYLYLSLCASVWLKCQVDRGEHEPILFCVLLGYRVSQISCSMWEKLWKEKTKGDDQSQRGSGAECSALWGQVCKVGVISGSVPCLSVEL